MKAKVKTMIKVEVNKDSVDSKMCGTPAELLAEICCMIDLMIERISDTTYIPTEYLKATLLELLNQD